jgi:tRNA A37 methylthiotransferase MiaB
MKKKHAKSVGFVSLGCSKALVDSEKLINSLTSDGVNIVDSFEEADLVVVNTCGFIDSAISESLSAIKEAKKKWESFNYWMFRSKKRCQWQSLKSILKGKVCIRLK